MKTPDLQPKAAADMFLRALRSAAKHCLTAAAAAEILGLRSRDIVNIARANPRLFRVIADVEHPRGGTVSMYAEVEPGRRKTPADYGSGKPAKVPKEPAAPLTERTAERVVKSLVRQRAAVNHYVLQMGSQWAAMPTRYGSKFEDGRNA